jgi:hypothetical protein
MVDILLNPSDGSSTLAEHPKLDMVSIRLWLAYDEDEISIVSLPQTTVEYLIDRIVDILCERGVIVVKEQIILRHDGETLDVHAVLSDYQLTHDDIIEILISRSIRSSRAEPIVERSPMTSHVMFSDLPVVTVSSQEIGHLHNDVLEEDALGDPFSQQSRSIGGIFRDIFSELPSVSVASRDIFLPPRDIFGAAEARGQPAAKGASDPLAQRSAMPNDTFSELPSVSVASRDIFLPPRDIFGAAEARGQPAAKGASDPLAQRSAMPNDPLAQRSVMPNSKPRSSSVGLRETTIPPRNISGTTNSMGAQSVTMAPRDLDPSPQRVLRTHPSSVPVRTSPISGTQPEFYGVRKGFQIGVCDSWDELVRRISGFPAPEFKTFTTWDDAKMYVMQGMWRDMPEGARPWVNPVPDWVLPGGKLQVDYGSRMANRTTPIAHYTAGQSRSTPDHQGSHTGTVLRRSLAMDNNAREPMSNMESSAAGGGSKGHDKIKQSFKCPRFSGNPKDWKIWNKGFMRFLSIWDLDYVLNPTFFDEFPLSVQKINDNKMVYFILEDATQGSPLAASYVRQAPVKNGFEAYYTLHDGFVFAGSTSSTILLNELANFRFKMDESPTALIMRLEELLQDLEMLPDGAAVSFNDTQRIGYLLGALRHEPEWANVTSSITSCQLRGDMTFRQACSELRFRCEAGRAYDIMDKDVKSKRKVPVMGAKIEELSDVGSEGTTTALVSTMAKRLNKDKGQQAVKEDKRKYQCLAKGCSTKTAFPLCGLHYHSVVSGKIASLELDGTMGMAEYNMTTKSIEYPITVPKERLPSDRRKSEVIKQ